jgi:glucokinase
VGQRIAVGVDIGGTKTLAILYSESLGILAQEQILTNRFAQPEVVLNDTTKLIQSIMMRSNVGMTDVSGIGVGVAGIIGPGRILIDSIILPEWSSVDVGAWLSAKLQTTVIVDNDANMAAIGHWSTHGNSPIQTMLCLTLGTGVGAAVILNGKLLRGPDGTAGQLGHITLDIFGRKCSCGGKGCLNAYVSGTAIGERYLERLPSTSIPPRTIADQRVTGRWVSEAAENGNRVAGEVIEETFLYLGAGLASLVNVFNPDVIVISGGVAELGDTLLDPTREAMHHRAFPQPARRVRVERGRFGPATGAIGAAISVWERF